MGRAAALPPVVLFSIVEMPRIHRSRRVPPLKHSDYDHEIDLVNDNSSEASSLSPGDATEAGQAFTTLRKDADSQPTALRVETDEVPNHQSSIRAVSGDASSTIPVFKHIPPTPAAGGCPFSESR